MNRDNNPLPLIILIGLLFIGYQVWQAIKGLAAFFEASPKETAFFLGWILITAVAAVAACFYNFLQIRIRTIAAGWLTLAFAGSHGFLSSIANGGMSPDDPMLWHFETTWYSSWITYFVIGSTLAAITVWLWREERYW